MFQLTGDGTGAADSVVQERPSKRSRTVRPAGPPALSDSPTRTHRPWPEAAIASIQPKVVVTGTWIVTQPAPARCAITGLVASFSPPSQIRAPSPARKPPPTGSAAGGCGVVAKRKPAGPATGRHAAPVQCSTVVAPCR